MIVCLACYKGRLASLYDTAADFLLHKVEDGHIYPVGRLSLPQRDPTQRITAFAAHGVSFLICGGICRRDRRELEHAGIRVAPWVCGEPEAVLHALVENRLHELTMPGCRAAIGADAPCPVGRGRGRGRGAHRAGNRGAGRGTPRRSGPEGDESN